jgi:2,4-dienoyl-CoA reductase-like NADH-dependent reductase (Old Yellow Enzyme family)
MLHRTIEIETVLTISQVMSRRTSLLFTPIQVGPTRLPNRFMRSATYEGRADANGLPSAELLAMITSLAKGGVGLIVPGGVYTQPTSRFRLDQTGIPTERHATSWRSTLSDIHSQTKSRVIFQLCHAGSKAFASPPPHLGPSEQHGVKEITVAEIEDVIQSFIRSSLWLKSAGADGVQLHGAHGFLLSAFLSPALNRRTDRYGGSVENRVRIVKEMASQIRTAAGPDFLLSVKLNGNDYLANGVTPELCGSYIEQLRPTIDLFEISAGAVSNRPFGSRVDFNPAVVRAGVKRATDAQQVIADISEWIKEVPFTEGYNIASAKMIRKVVGNANLAVCGGLRRFAQMEGIVNDGTVQLVSLSRPFLRQPDLVNALMMEGRDADCIFCGLCQHAPRVGGATCRHPRV